MTLETFLSRAKAVHGDRYDYSKVQWFSANTPIKIVCAVHGAFMQLPATHLIPRQCRRCAIEAVAAKRAGNTNDFILRAKAIHGDRYDYSDVVYRRTHEAVNIRCAKHGLFPQSPSGHLGGQGCPMCCTRRSEEMCRTILQEIYGHPFTKSRPHWLEKRTELDGYRAEHKVAFEYQGKQHTHYVPFFHNKGGVNDLHRQQQRDQRKAELCREKGVDLIVIPWTVDANTPDKLFEWIVDRVSALPSTHSRTA